MSKKKSAKKRTVTAPQARTPMSTLPQAKTSVSTAPQAKMPMSTSPRAASAANSAKPTPITASSAEAIAQAQAGFAEEYHYVLADLKRIGLIAASMAVVLAALALIIR
jgi:hypothetical protein